MEEIYRRPAYPLPWDDIPGFIVYFLLDLVAVIKFSMVMGSAFLILYGIGKCISLIFWALFYKIDKALEKNRVVPGCDGAVDRLIVPDNFHLEDDSEQYREYHKYHDKMCSVVNKRWCAELEELFVEPECELITSDVTYIVLYLAASNAKYEDRKSILFKDLDIGFKGFEELTPHSRNMMLQSQPLAYAPPKPKGKGFKADGATIEEHKAEEDKGEKPEVEEPNPDE